jgi:diaminohydroxyphosphoribosylaminopyrimidine deaminase / 5-amino-6-(5-phosphoribosylamino)uracil reductase
MGEEQGSLVDPIFRLPAVLCCHREGTLLEQNKLEAAMSRALEIALNGPYLGVNPQVGAVILDQTGRIVSEGWHQGAGTPHAEVMAIENLKQSLGYPFPAGLTAVVTLEPCNHTGRTGPCSQALIAAGITSVAYASNDPGSNSSNGSTTLRDAGVEVESGILLEQAEEQNRVWLTANRLRRPFVSLKWASSLDGRAAAPDGSSKWISSELAREDVHLRRSRADAVLAGTGTIEADDSELTARMSDGEYYPEQPLRVVLGERELTAGRRVFNDRAETVQIRHRDLEAALTQLWERGIKHVFVEGGPTIYGAFIDAGLVDEYLIYLAPVLIGGDKLAIGDIGVGNISQAKRLEVLEQSQIGTDFFIRARSK